MSRRGFGRTVVRMLETAGIDLHLAPLIANRRKARETILVLPDSQNGYKGELPMHDRLAWEAAVWVASELQPDGVVQLGDMLDLPEFSHFRKRPETLGKTQLTLDETWWWNARLRKAAPKAWGRWLAGNHEDRYKRTLGECVPDLAELHALQLPTLLRLKDLGVEYIDDYPTYWMYRGVEFQHGDKYSKTGGQTAAKYLTDVPHSVVYGHSHKREYACKTYNGRTKFAASPGVMCHIDGRVPAKSKRVDWQQGLMLVHFDRNDNAWPELLPIEKGVLLFRGESVSLKHNDSQRLKDLREIARERQ